MNQKEQPRFVGIDISKGEFAIAVRPTGDTQSFPNTADGLTSLAEFLRPLCRS